MHQINSNMVRLLLIILEVFSDFNEHTINWVLSRHSVFFLAIIPSCQSGIRGAVPILPIPQLMHWVRVGMVRSTLDTPEPLCSALPRAVQHKRCSQAECPRPRSSKRNPLGSLKAALGWAKCSSRPWQSQIPGARSCCCSLHAWPELLLTTSHVQGTKVQPSPGSLQQ